MTKLEKVVKGLECCKTGPTFKSDCEDKKCPYRTDHNFCIETLCADALEVLKDQEPWVLTLDEVLNGDECWFEYRAINFGQYADCYMHNDSKKAAIFFTGNAVTHQYELADYGKTWRCWNTRPTYEQRKAVKWNDEN